MRRVLAWLKKINPLRISVGIALCFSALHFTIENETFENGPLSQRGYIHQLDLKALDLKFRGLEGEDLPEPKVIIAAIDEKGVERFGLWPWRRSVIADFITAATKGGAKVIGFDAVFSDEDRNASYMDIKGFLDTYKQQDLSPETAGARGLLSQISSLEEQGAETAEAIAALDRALKKEGANKLAGPLKKAKQSSDRISGSLRKAKTTLAAYYSRAGHFESSLSSVVEAGSPDAALEHALANSPVTIMGYFNFYDANEIVGVDKEQLALASSYLDKSLVEGVYEETYQEIGGNLIESVSPVEVDMNRLWVKSIVASRAPLPRFGAAGKHFGYFNVNPDPDGPMRQIRLLNRAEGKLYPALSLAAAAQYLDAEIRPIYGSIKPNTIDGIKLGDRLVPTNFRGHLMVNYYKDPALYFPTYSVSEFIDGTLEPEKYKGKVVLFGMTAQGLYDLRPTPFSTNTPGVYIHASAIQNIIDNRFLERYFGIALIEILAFLLLGVVMGLTMPRVPPWAGALVTIAFAVGLYFFDTAFVFSRGTWMLNVLPTIQATTTFVAVTLYGYFTEGKEKRKIRNAFQFYLTKSVVDEMLKEPHKLKLGGEKRVCTVLFSDIRGFTTISERLTPEQLTGLLNEYLTPMTNMVFKYDGTLDKYMGDAIMAIFGAPVTYEDHAARACYCSLDMMAELKVLQEGWRARNYPELDIGIGLNTGDMVVGNMGSNIRFDYTVMGDNVNLGSRLEGINKQYGSNIIISEYTRAHAGDRVHVRTLDAVRVKGKREPVTIYELLGKGVAPPAAQELITTFEKGISLYRQQNWQEAVATFDRVRKDIKPNDYASNMYIERCGSMQEHPPGADWDGVYTMTTK